MAVCKEVVDLVNRLNGVTTRKRCQRMYCTTCGGKSESIFRNGAEFRELIKSALSQSSTEDLEALGSWLSVLVELSPFQFSMTLSRISESIDERDVSGLDRFIYIAFKCAGSFGSLNASCSKSLVAAHELAIKTQDESLIETLILVKGTELLDDPDLLALSLSMRHKPKIARALYNKLREHVPEVRNLANGVNSESNLI